MNNNRFDKFARHVGDSTSIPDAGEALESLTLAGTGAALLNEGLNQTSLGKKPRGGFTNAYKAGDPTTWQHTVSGQIGRNYKAPVIGRVGRSVGRIAKAVSLGLLALEAGYTSGTFLGCTAECAARKPLCN